MSNPNFTHLIRLLKKVALAFLVFTLCRVAFFIVNASHFDDVTLSLFLYGIRFDAVAIAYLLSPLIILELLPFSFRNSKIYRLFMSFFFYLGMSIGVVLNLIDVAYFGFSFKRTTTDFFSMIGVGGGDDFMKILPNYVIDFWYDYIILAILVTLFYQIHKRIIKQKNATIKFSIKSRLVQTIIFIVVLGVTVIAMRGGLQYKPIDIVNAGQYTKAQNTPVILNTPFTIIKTLFDKNLDQKTYFDENDLDKIYSPLTAINSKGKFNKKNVVVIILESFAKEYVGGFNNGEGYTPFIDSLLDYSYKFNKAYSNGLRSIEALPSILAGLPPIMNANFVVSSYSANKLDALPSELKNVGYNTSFYHSGANGTMSFNGFVGSIGVDNYYGIDEYPEELKEQNKDGFWGIFDEPYLQYYAEELNSKSTPFFSTIFTISSHHPYTIPKEHINHFDKGNLPLHETVGYTDYALKQFFNTAKKMPWFNNTIFVFTADHSAASNAPTYNNYFNLYAIPVFIYAPTSNLIGENNNYFQQTDITPTVLNLLNINDTIISFGNDAFGVKEKFAVNFIANNYQIYMGDYFLQFNGTESIGLYFTKTDILLQNNLVNQTDNKLHLKAKNKLENKLKAIIQQYNNRLINNHLSYVD